MGPLRAFEMALAPTLQQFIAACDHPDDGWLAVGEGLPRRGLAGSVHGGAASGRGESAVDTGSSYRQESVAS